MQIMICQDCDNKIMSKRIYLLYERILQNPKNTEYQTFSDGSCLQAIEILEKMGLCITTECNQENILLKACDCPHIRNLSR